MKPVFIHINKTAGTSIIASAGKQIVSAGHQTAAGWVAAHGRAHSLFTIIRNPYDRVLSEYLYRKGRYDSGEQNPHLVNLDRTFGDWVVATYRDGEFCTLSYFERTGVPYNAATMIDGMLIWFLPQTRWISGENRELLVDDILRYETLKTDWVRFMKKHRLSANLEHRNASPRPPGLDPRYTEQAREAVRSHFREDFYVFGYPT